MTSYYDQSIAKSVLNLLLPTRKSWHFADLKYSNWGSLDTKVNLDRLIWACIKLLMLFQMLIVTDIIGFPGTDLERPELFAIKVCLSYKKSKNSLTTLQFDQLWSHLTENSFLNMAFMCLLSQDTVLYHTLLFKQGSRSTAEIYVGKRLWKKQILF